MATFHVGQRVRIVGRWLGYSPSPVGQEGRILERGTFVGATTMALYEWVVLPDNGVRVLANSEELEPILPQGHEACDAEFKLDLDRLVERVGEAA